jgi:hypothetical protein
VLWRKSAGIPSAGPRLRSYGGQGGFYVRAALPISATPAGMKKLSFFSCFYVVHGGFVAQKNVRKLNICVKFAVFVKILGQIIFKVKFRLSLCSNR